MAKQNQTAYGLSSPFVDYAPKPIIAQRAPTATDTNYSIGTTWIDQPNDDVYVFTSEAGAAATWAVSSTGTVMLDGLLPDGGTSPVVPSAAHKITVAGGTNITSVGGLNTVTFNLDAAITLATSVTSPLYTAAAAMDINAFAATNITMQMGDDVGANLIEFENASSATVGSLNSLGELIVTNVECGTNLARTAEYTTNLSVIQAFADDDTASGVSVRSAIYGNMQPSAGDGNGTPNAIWGYLSAAAASNTLQVNGVYGLCQQEDGSIIVSTAAGVEGHLNLLETNNADLPSYLAAGVKGYLDSTDTAGIPGGMLAGVASVTEYNTPFDAKAYGFLASRLDTPGGSAGTAAQAAFGVLQGTNAIADWLYGLDLYNGATGVAYTNADIRFQNEATLAVDTEGLTLSGDLEARSLNATNTRIIAFNEDPIGQLNGGAGALCTGATGTVNNLHMQDGVMMQSFMIGAGQTKILPIMEADGLEIALDLTATEGVEYNFGVLASNKHAYTIGTSPAFFFECRFKVADVSGCEPLIMGFRKQEANNGTYTAYTDYATIGIVTSQNADLITLATELNGGGTTYTNTTDGFVDGATHTLRVNVDASGNVTYLIDGAAPSATAAFQFDNADVVMPFIHLVHAAVAPGKIHLISMACGYQAWN